MSHSNASIGKLSRAISNRLNGVSTPADIYSLAYLARASQKAGKISGANEAIELASNGDSDVAALLGNAFSSIAPAITIKELIDTVTAFGEEALDAFLEHGPIAQNIFDREFETPEGVVRLALAVLDIKPGNKVINLGSGQGHFLEAAAQKCPEAELTGVEINSDALATAKMRSHATGSKISYICEDMFRFYENSIRNSPVDKAFSNYPLGLKTKMLPKTSAYIEKVLKGQDQYRRPLSSDWVFNRLLVDSLKEDGAAVAIMTNGACFNGTDKSVREYFVKNGFIRAIVSLPQGVFAPHSSIMTSLIILCAGGSKGIRFVDATDLGTNDRRSCSIDDAAIETILERLGTDSEKSAFKTIDEITARDFDLFAWRCLEKEIEVPNGIELGSVASIARGAGVRAAELDALVCEEDTGLSYLNLGNISDGCIDDDLPNLSVLDPKLEKYCIDDGDVLISKTGAPFKVAVAEVPQDRKVLANGNLYVLKVDKEKIDPYYLAAFFSSPTGKELLARQAVGTAIPNMPIRALSTIKVPLENAERQKAVADAYLAKTDEIKVLKLRLARARQEITDLFDEER